MSKITAKSVAWYDGNHEDKLSDPKSENECLIHLLSKKACPSWTLSAKLFLNKSTKKHKNLLSYHGHDAVPLHSPEVPTSLETCSNSVTKYQSS